MYMYTEAQNHCLFLFNSISKAYIIIGSSLELKIHRFILLEVWHQQSQKYLTIRQLGLKLL